MNRFEQALDLTPEQRKAFRRNSFWHGGGKFPLWRPPFDACLRAGKLALQEYNPCDERTHPAVHRIIRERGERAYFFVRDGMLFQLATGPGDQHGRVRYYPVRSVKGNPLNNCKPELESIFGKNYMEAIL